MLLPFLSRLAACAQGPAPAELRVVDPSGIASRDATFDFGGGLRSRVSSVF